jgi:hypothetical protein
VVSEKFKCGFHPSPLACNGAPENRVVQTLCIGFVKTNKVGLNSTNAIEILPGRDRLLAVLPRWSIIG